MCGCANQILMRVLEDEGEREVVSKLIRDMQEQTRLAWEREIRSAVQAGTRALVKAPSAEVGVTRMNQVLTSSLAGVFTRAEIARITASVRGMYTAFKHVSTGQLGIGFSFRQIDQRAVRALAREQPFWIGNFYSKQMSDRIRDMSQKVIVEQGLGRREAARVMARSLRKDLSWADGPVRIRGIDLKAARFAGNVEGYSEIVVSNIANRGRNMGFLSSFADAGIEVYRWNSVLDERTSEQCVFMNGREFPVSRGVSFMDELSATETPEQVKGVAPWQSANQLEKTAGTGSFAKQNQNLSSAGIMLPPIHGRCRSVVEAVG